MALDYTGTYTDAEVADALTARRGIRRVSFRYDRLDELNAYVEPIDYVVTASVDNNALADIKRTAKFTMLERGGINYLKDRIRPWMRLGMEHLPADGRRGYVEWPLGVFVLSTPGRVLSADVVSREVDAYDQLVVLRDDKVTDRYSVAAGAKYTDALATLAFGFSASIIPSSLTLPAAMEWETGTPKLRIVNDLLAALNYESAWFDEWGTLVCRPYQSPTVRPPLWSYRDDSASVISGDVGQTIDLFDVPNRWVLTVSEADRVKLTTTYTNTDPASPTSTVSRGRIITDVRTDEDAANQATLDAKAQRYAFDASQVFEVVEFRSLLMPMHTNGDVVELTLSGLAIAGAKYSEHTWSLPLEAGSEMSHKVRRVVSV